MIRRLPIFSPLNSQSYSSSLTSTNKVKGDIYLSKNIYAFTHICICNKTRVCAVATQLLSCVSLFCNPIPIKSTGVGYHSRLQGIFLTQGLNLCLLLDRQIIYHQATRETLNMCIHMCVYIHECVCVCVCVCIVYVYMSFFHTNKIIHVFCSAPCFFQVEIFPYQ